MENLNVTASIMFRNNKKDNLNGGISHPEY